MAGQVTETTDLKAAAGLVASGLADLADSIESSASNGQGLRELANAISALSGSLRRHSESIDGLAEAIAGLKEGKNG